MRKIALVIMEIVVSMLLVGCGTNLKTNPSNSKPYVYFSNGSAGKTIYFKLTNIQVWKLLGGYKYASK
jgi:uncharacterized protein YceK